MSAQARPGGPGPAGARPQRDGNGGSSALRTVLQSVAMFFGMQLLLGQLGIGQKPKTKLQADVASAETDTQSAAVPTTSSTPPVTAVPLFETGSLLDVFVALSADQDPVSPLRNNRGLQSILWKDVRLCQDSRVWETEWSVPPSVQRNASFSAHVYVTPAGVEPLAALQGAGDVAYVNKPLTRYSAQKKIRATKNLLSKGAKDDDSSSEADQQHQDVEKKDMPIVSYYHPNLTIAMVESSGPLALSGLPPVLRRHVQIARPGQKDDKGNVYHHPIFWTNDFWLLREHMYLINETTTSLPLRISLETSSFFKFQVMESMHESMNEQAKQSGGGSELDIIKRVLTESNPYLLITTLVVSLLHMLFEFLAFTSDISHWRNKKEMTGVSVRTILTNCATQLIILLYLIDSSEETSTMILASQGIGLVIEAWKITKAVDVKVVPKPASIIPYTIEFHDKHVLTEDEKRTQEFDALAFKWVAWGTTPFIIGYTIYSLIYNEHRGWYSFTLATLTSFTYAFGFVTLIPQLIINYKLKSVAHLPMKTLSYKFLNTIIDDLMAFTIRMPILHRLSVFRDDVCFVILLYQYWIYALDPTRENEYGQKMTEEQAAKFLAEKQAKAKADAAAAGTDSTESRKNR